MQVHFFMEETKEIQALLHLIDDPDSEVYSTVSSRIVSFGKQIIPNLEHLWETTPDPETQERIEMLIHRLHFQDLQQDFQDWSNQDDPDLLTGVLLVSKYQYPELNLAPIQLELEKIRRNIWLELNPFLTALEQVNVLSNILFNYYKFKGNEVNYTRPDEFLFPRLIESKKGNAISNGLLILIMAKQLDINLQLIAIPRQFIMACFSAPIGQDEDMAQIREKIHFFVDGASGQMYSHADVETYFKRIDTEFTQLYFRPQSNKQIVMQLLGEFSKCFTSALQQHKRQELLDLASMIRETV